MIERARSHRPSQEASASSGADLHINHTRLRRSGKNLWQFGGISFGVNRAIKGDRSREKPLKIQAKRDRSYSSEEKPSDRSPNSSEEIRI
ncbi:MAG: hypothetical protein KME22_25070 [Hassallia sp. WJT32-NPBG1]|nr:hypothetical protein [Hassallia sp. WJT32-NPBG1]